jgi:hypothetical protein
MTPNASTRIGVAKLPQPAQGDYMGRLFLLVVLLGLMVMAVGLVMLGAFPPEPHPQQIQKVLPNDRFSHGQ